MDCQIWGKCKRVSIFKLMVEKCTEDWLEILPSNLTATEFVKPTQNFARNQARTTRLLIVTILQHVGRRIWPKVTLINAMINTLKSLLRCRKTIWRLIVSRTGSIVTSHFASSGLLSSVHNSLCRDKHEKSLEWWFKFFWKHGAKWILTKWTI